MNTSKNRNKSDQLLEYVGSYIKALRLQQGITLEEVVIATRIPVAIVEAGKKDITIDKLSILCDFYQTSLYAFFRKIENDGYLSLNDGNCDAKS